jgi:hypothetical protein
MNSFFTWHIFLEVGKAQDLLSNIWQTLGCNLFMISHILHMTKVMLVCQSSSLARFLYITKQIPFRPTDTSSGITKRIQQKSGLLFLP